MHTKSSPWFVIWRLQPYIKFSLLILKMRMHEKMTVKSILIGKDNFTVTVYPNIDYDSYTYRHSRRY